MRYCARPGRGFRHRADGDLGVMSTEDFMAQLKELVDTKACK